MPRALRTSYRLTPDIIAAHDGGTGVVCLDARAIGRDMPMLASAPTTWATVRLGDFGGHGSTIVGASEPTPGALAVVTVRGPLAQRGGYQGECGGWIDGHDVLAARLIGALEDATIGAVMMTFDTPGGAAAGIGEAVRRTVAAKEASGKKVIGWVDERCGSAGAWWALCVCDEVYLPEAGELGSLGARGDHKSIAGALAQEGIAITYFTWPDEGKVALAPEMPLTELGAARGQRDVNAIGEAFAAAVGPARGLSRDEIAAMRADMYRGHEAVARGLADGVSTIEEVTSYALSLASGVGGKIMAEPDDEKGPPGEGEPAEGLQPSGACASCGMAQRAESKFCDQCGLSMAAPPIEEPDDDGPKSKPGASAHAPAAALATAAKAPAVSAPSAHAASLVSFAALGMKLTGTTSVAEAEGGIRALATRAAETDTLREALATRDAKAEKSERWDLAARLVASNAPGHSRGAVIIDSVAADGKRSMALTPMYAEMKIDTMRGLVQGLERNAVKPAPFEPDRAKAEAAAAEAAAAKEAGGVTVAQIEAAKKSPAVQRIFGNPGNRHSLDAIAKQFLIASRGVQ